MQVYLVRHGETDWNVEQRAQGSTDIPLNQNGIAQAKALAQNIRAKGLQFDTIYSSPLQRTHQTAKIIAGNQSIILDERLGERHFGKLEGQVINDWYSLGVDLFDPNINSDAFGVERVSDFIARTRSILDDLRQNHLPDACVLLVGSRGTLAQLAMQITGLDYEHIPKLDNAKMCSFDFSPLSL